MSPPQSLPLKPLLACTASIVRPSTLCSSMSVCPSQVAVAAPTTPTSTAPPPPPTPLHPPPVVFPSTSEAQKKGSIMEEGEELERDEPNGGPSGMEKDGVGGTAGADHLQHLFQDFQQSSLQTLTLTTNSLLTSIQTTLLDPLQAQLAQRSLQLSSSNKTINCISSSKDELSKQLNALQASSSDWERRARTSEAELVNEKRRAETAQKRASQLHGELDGMEKELEKVMQVKNKAAEEAATSSESLQKRFEEVISKVEREKSQLFKEKNELGIQLKRKEVEMGVLEGRVEGLEKEREEGERKRDALRKGIQALVECRREEQGRWESVLGRVEALNGLKGGDAMEVESCVGRAEVGRGGEEDQLDEIAALVSAPHPSSTESPTLIETPGNGSRPSSPVRTSKDELELELDDDQKPTPSSRHSSSASPYSISDVTKASQPLYNHQHTFNTTTTEPSPSNSTLQRPLPSSLKQSLSFSSASDFAVAKRVRLEVPDVSPFEAGDDEDLESRESGEMSEEAEEEEDEEEEHGRSSSVEL